MKTSLTPRVSVCWHCSIMVFFSQCGQALICLIYLFPLSKSHLLMGESCTFHIQSKSHCLGVRILHISHPVKVTSSGGGILHISHTKLHQWGVGVFHISHPVKVISSGGWYPPYFTSRQSHINRVWYPPHFTCKVTSMGGWDSPHFTFIQSHIIRKGVWVGGILHISHPVKVTSWGWVDGWYPPHFMSSQSYIILGIGYPPHLTNQVECASAVKPNLIPLLYANTA